ncbi:MAG: glycosyltransferase [Bacteroidia bacterium]|nr:glycosyltransferase [Bacteroidia bacterium]MDW8301533.1 glycosyltransferase [Bacteroidia bacterium]
MNILEITPRIPYPPNDGGAIAMYNTIKYLQKAQNTVTVLALNTNKHYQDPVVLQDICSAVHSVEINTDIRLFKAMFNLFKRVPYNVERFISKKFAQKIEQVLNQQSFDLIQLEGTFVAWYVDIIKKHTKVPVFLRAHNVEYLIWERLYKNAPRHPQAAYIRYLSKKLKQFEKEYFNKFDGILAITAEDAQRMREDLQVSVPIQVIPAGVDFEIFQPNPDISTLPNSLFLFGSLDWIPNVEAVLWFYHQIFPKLKEQYPDIQIHIGGKNPPSEILSLHDEKHIFVYPNVPSARDFMQSFEIMLVPLRSGGGMRIKIIEAMAMGKIVISTSVGAEGILVQNEQNILIANSPQEFVTQITRCFEDSGLKQKIAQNAYVTARQHYDWQNITKKMINFYQQIIRSMSSQKS